MRQLTAWPLAMLAAAALIAACGKKAEPASPAPAAPVANPTAAPPAPAPASAVASAAAAPASAPVSAPASTDPDSPTPLTTKTLKGVGLHKTTSLYYGFNGGPGTLTITATAKNVSSGATNALTVGVYDGHAERLCWDSAGNSTQDKTFTVSCKLDKAQPLVLRLDLSEESIDYSVTLDGPVQLAAEGAAAAASSPAAAGAGSTDIDEPTRLSTNRLKGDGPGQQVSYYYTFNAGPGELTVTMDGKNRSAAVTDALLVTLYNLRSERLCWTSLGNTTLDKRAVMGCKLDAHQPVILRVDLSPETIDWRVRFEGPYDFEAYTPPKQVTIALDAAALFDTGKSTIKPDAQRTLHEAAERIKKFAQAPVTISGHTDNVGSDAANQALSEQRARAVKDWLVSREGVSAERLTAKGFGKTQPLADNGSEAGRARNRRVDVVIATRG
jgi:outer membrane protein OmpA-like peptidoglycan-associated protein